MVSGLLLKLLANYCFINNTVLIISYDTYYLSVFFLVIAFFLCQRFLIFIYYISILNNTIYDKFGNSKLEMAEGNWDSRNL